MHLLALAAVAGIAAEVTRFEFCRVMDPLHAAVTYVTSAALSLTLLLSAALQRVKPDMTAYQKLWQTYHADVLFPTLLLSTALQRAKPDICLQGAATDLPCLMPCY
jgi:hypothetical protein